MNTNETIKDINNFIKPPKEVYGEKHSDGVIWNVKISNTPEKGFEYCNYKIPSLEQASEIWNKMSAKTNFIKENIDPKDINKDQQIYYIVENYYSKSAREKGFDLPERFLIK